MSEVKLFDFLNSITEKQIEYQHDQLTSYPEFMVNRFLSMGDDTVFFANEASKMNSIPKYLQYYFLFRGVNKKKRYFKYAKGNKTDKYVKVICDYYNVREEIALEYLQILTKEQISEINSLYEKAIER